MKSAGRIKCVRRSIPYTHRMTVTDPLNRKRIDIINELFDDAFYACKRASTDRRERRGRTIRAIDNWVNTTPVLHFASTHPTLLFTFSFLHARDETRLAHVRVSIESDTNKIHKLRVSCTA